MNIKRYGASAYHGISQVNLPCPVITWDVALQGLKVTKSNVKDFSTEARHNYIVEFPVEDICMLLNVLAGAAKENPSQFEQTLECSLKSLAMLQAVASGIKT